MNLVNYFSSIPHLLSQLNPLQSAEIIFKLTILKNRTKLDFSNNFDDLNENRTLNDNLFAINKLIMICINDFLSFSDSSTQLKIISLILVLNPDTNKYIQKNFISKFMSILTSNEFIWSEKNFLFVINWFDGICKLFDLCSEFLIDMSNPKLDIFPFIKEIFEPDFCASKP